jgi:cobalt/nickel transport system ATP-binding protein
LLEEGRLVAQGTPGEILHNSDLLDRMNLIHMRRHRHPSGEVHSHPHIHRGEH